MSLDIIIPDIGDFDAVEVIEVLVAVGDSIEAEQSLIVLESDKATMEVPAEASGTVESLCVKAGDKVAQGDKIGSLLVAENKPEDGDKKVQSDTADTTATASPPVPATPSDASPEKVRQPRASSSPALPSNTSDLSNKPSHAGPAARRLARELGVDLSRVQGSGPRDRILKEDIQRYVKTTLSQAPGTTSSAVPQMPSVDFSKFGETESKALSRIRKLSAANLHRNWVVVPHVTQFDSADITELEAFRKAESAGGSVKLTLLPFVIKAVTQCLRAFPDFNTSLSPDGESLIVKKYCHIGFAADTPNGLVVPVIRDADNKSISELAAESAELAASARDGKLKPAQMQGGCFSISSLGGIGGSHFTPIVNAPEVAILGVSRAKIEAVWTGDSFEPRLMLPLSLSYDHRVIDGAAAARFISYLSAQLTDIRRWCL